MRSFTSTSRLCMLSASATTIRGKSLSKNALLRQPDHASARAPAITKKYGGPVCGVSKVKLVFSPVVGMPWPEQVLSGNAGSLRRARKRPAKETAPTTCGNDTIKDA